ncbi:DUF6214 family protein [Streptomyces sp. NPDC001393]
MSVWPAWEVREQGDATTWFYVRLAFPDGARVDALAVMREGRVSIEDVTAEPALSLADLTALADWIEAPLFEACGVAAEQPYEGEGDSLPAEGEPEAGDGDGGGEESCDAEQRDDVGDEDVGEEEGGAFCAGPRRARPVWPRGIEGRRLVAQEYRAAQEGGADPVLAVMNATGHSRRRALRLIAQARDAGFLTPRHARRD